jgi:hypothetical protein
MALQAAAVAEVDMVLVLHTPAAAAGEGRVPHTAAAAAGEGELLVLRHPALVDKLAAAAFQGRQ